MTNDQRSTSTYLGIGRWSLVIRGLSDAEADHDLHDPRAAAEDPHHAAVPGDLPHRLLDPAADGGPGQAGEEGRRSSIGGARAGARPGVARSPAATCPTRPSSRLGIMPYISASIILQLLAASGSVPSLERLRKRAERPEENQRIHALSHHPDQRHPGDLLDTRAHCARTQRLGDHGAPDTARGSTTTGSASPRS